MSYAQFTLAFNDKPVYVHWRHVVSVTENYDGTVIYTTALNSGGNGQSWTVKEHPQDVLAALNGHERASR